MIKQLDLRYEKQVLDFCYLCEKENLFVIGSFTNYKNTFEQNAFYGYFENEKLVGLGVFFTRFGNLAINAPNKRIIAAIIDFAMHNNSHIECIAAFKQYADSTIKHLQQSYGKTPKTISDQTVFLLEKKDFIDYSNCTETRASTEDIDELAIFNSQRKKEKVTEIERKKVFFENEFVLRINETIVSKANIHGASKHYFQIGGVGTLETHRRKGYARQVVSKLCQSFFDEGLQYGLLFTANDNIAAQKVYIAIGFKPIDKFVVAQY